MKINKKEYTTFQKEQINKEILNYIQINDLIKINDWNKPMRVKGVSKNYVVMTCNNFGELYYSVISKIPFDGIRYNNLTQGDYYCGPDYWLFGETDFDYKFNDPLAIKKYLETFENGHSQISLKSHTIPINILSIKRG